MPEALNGALVDSLSGHALSAAGLAASFLMEGAERARLTAPPTSICSVIRAHKPGWCFVVGSDGTLRRKNIFLISSILVIDTTKKSVLLNHFSNVACVYGRNFWRQTVRSSFKCFDMKKTVFFFVRVQLD